MTTATDGQVPPGFPREPDCGGHVVRRAGPGYHPWPPVDVTVPHALSADGVIVGVIGSHDPAREAATE